jgi:hypothetical protein
MWWEVSEADDTISVHGKYRPITYDLPMENAFALLGEPHYTNILEQSGTAVMEWACGCSACRVNVLEQWAVQWCTLHASQSS